MIIYFFLFIFQTYLIRQKYYLLPSLYGRGKGVGL